MPIRAECAATTSELRNCNIWSQSVVSTFLTYYIRVLWHYGLCYQCLCAVVCLYLLQSPPMQTCVKSSSFSVYVDVRLYSFLLMHWCIMVDTSCIYKTIISILQHGIQCQSTCCLKGHLPSHEPPVFEPHRHYGGWGTEKSLLDTVSGNIWGPCTCIVPCDLFKVDNNKPEFNFKLLPRPRAMMIIHRTPTLFWIIQELFNLQETLFLLTKRYERCTYVL